MNNKRGPGIDACRTPNIISSKLLYDEFVFIRCFLFDKWLCTTFHAVKQKPYAFSFTMTNSWWRHSKAFDKSANKAPNILLLSTDLFHFSNIARRHCRLLKPSKTHNDISKMHSQKIVTFLQTCVFQLFLINVEECSLVCRFLWYLFYLFCRKE